MNELRPLRVASNQAVSRLLLESALADHSAPGAADRALQALNLGAAAAVAASVATAHVTATSSGASQFALAIALKWLGLGLVGGALTLVAADRILQPSSEPKTARAPDLERLEKPGIAPINQRTLPPAVPSEPEVAASSAKVQPNVAVPAARTAESAAPASGVTAPAADPLQDLRAIRRALAEHAPARALALLDAFVTRYPSSTLLEEAAVLRFDALLSSQSSEARAAGQSFLRRYPRSAYAERVRLKLSGRP